MYNHEFEKDKANASYQGANGHAFTGSNNYYRADPIVQNEIRTAYNKAKSTQDVLNMYSNMASSSPATHKPTDYSWMVQSPSMGTGNSTETPEFMLAFHDFVMRYIVRSGVAFILVMIASNSYLAAFLFSGTVLLVTLLMQFLMDPEVKKPKSGPVYKEGYKKWYKEMFNKDL